jgi:hypothetical protein
VLASGPARAGSPGSLAGGQTIQTLLDNLGQVVPGSVNKTLEGMIGS